MEKAKAEMSRPVPVMREAVIPTPKKKLLDQVREVMRLKHYSIRTEQTYISWIRRYLIFHRDHPHLDPTLSPPSEGAEREKKWRHPRELGAAEIESFLTDLAVQRRVSSSTQNQALNAIVFVYKQVLHQEPGEFAAVRAKRPGRLPTVLTKAEVQRLFAAMKPGTLRLMARLLYGTGMRLMEVTV
jgi:integrase